MPVTSTRRISTSSTTGLPPFSGSTLSTSSYRRSTALSPSRFTSSSSTSSSGLGVGYYRSLSSSNSGCNYLSNRSSIAGYPSNESSYVSSRYSSKSTTGGDSGLGSSERARGSGFLGSRASIARSVALSGVDLYAKYSPANYVPNSDLSRSRSLTDANRGTCTSQSTPTLLVPRKGLSSNSSIGSSHRRAQVYEEDGDDGDENNNTGSSRSGRSSLRRPKVALGGAGSALDSVDGEIKVTAKDNHINPPALLLLSPCEDAESNTSNKSNNNNNQVINSQSESNKRSVQIRSSNKNNRNVTKITINHSTPNGGTSVILNNSHCTSSNRAIVHIFNDTQQQHQQVVDQRNNNNNHKSHGSGGARVKINGDLVLQQQHIRRDQEESSSNGARIIKVQQRHESKSKGSETMLLRQGLSNGTTTTGERSSYKSATAGVKLKRDPEIFLRDECDLVRNELMQKKIAEHNPRVQEELQQQEQRSKEQNLNKYCRNSSSSTTTNTINKSRMESGGGGSSVAYRNGVHCSPMDTSEDTSQQPQPQMNGSRARSKLGSMSSHSSNSSSASSLMDSGSRSSNFEDIKFIDSDDNNDASSIGAQLNGASSRISKLNRTLASTLDSLKASTPIVGNSMRQYNVTNGHHTLPHHSSSSVLNGGRSGSASSNGVLNGGRLNGGVDYTKKYSTLSNLPSKSSVIRNGLSNGLFEKGYSKDAIIMGLVPKEDEQQNGEETRDELIIKESPLDAMVTTSEPPNDKISGKSWEVNGTNGSASIRTSSLRNALPPVSPVRTWERDRPRYRELLDAEPSTTSSSKYDAYTDKSSSDTVEGLCGLRNIGNTCFMNSVIQCLSHTHDLTKFLRAQRDPKSVTKDQRIFAEYVKLIKDMWSVGTRTVTPMELKSAVSSKHRMYSGCGQQDAQEFLRFFLEALHGACNEGTKQEGLTLDDNLSDGKRADLMWDWYSKTESSLIKDHFVGQLRSTLKCTVCGNTSVTFDPFWDLSVPLPPSSSRCTLQNCLDLFIREEVLDGEEMPTCSKCKTRRKSTKSFTIQRFPKYLVIHLKRFSETRWSKLTNVVEFPLGERELNLAPYASNNTAGSPHYTLYGISNHMGSTAGGHYVALCKHPQTRKWHEFNDNHVSDSSESSLISSSAYLLFYERA